MKRKSLTIGACVASLALAVLMESTAWPAMMIYLIQLLTFVAVLYLATRDSIRYRLVPGKTRRERAHQPPFAL